MKHFACSMSSPAGDPPVGEPSTTAPPSQSPPAPTAANAAIEVVSLPASLRCNESCASRYIYTNLRTSCLGYGWRLLVFCIVCWTRDLSISSLLTSFRTGITDTESLRSSVLNYKWEHGRRYHAYGEGPYWCGGFNVST